MVIEANTCVFSWNLISFVILSIIIGLNGQYRIVYDENEQSSSILQCGSEVLIQHRSSDLCLTMTKNEQNKNLSQVGLKECYAIDTNQRWIIHCCDQYLLRCGKYNPFINELQSDLYDNDHDNINDNNNNNNNNRNILTYDSYFQIQQKMTKLCISTASIWRNNKNNQSVYLQQCQLSLLDVSDSIQSIKIQRDKFAFNDGDDSYGISPIYTNHFTKFINLETPLCLGYDNNHNQQTHKLLKGYNCNLGRDKRTSLQFKFIPLGHHQTQRTNTPHTDF